MEDDGRVAAVVDAVVRGVEVMEVSELLCRQAFDLLRVADVDPEGPAPRQVVVDHL